MEKEKGLVAPKRDLELALNDTLIISGNSATTVSYIKSMSENGLTNRISTKLNGIDTFLGYTVESDSFDVIIGTGTTTGNTVVGICVSFGPLLIFNMFIYG